MKNKSGIQYQVHEPVNLRVRGRKKPIVPDVPRPPGISSKNFFGNQTADFTKIGSWTKIRLDARKTHTSYANLYLMDASSFFPSINLMVIQTHLGRAGSVGVSFQAKGGATYIVRFFVHAYPDNYKFDLYTNESPTDQTLNLFPGYNEVPVVVEISQDGNIDVQLRLISKNGSAKIEAVEIQRVKA